MQIIHKPFLFFFMLGLLATQGCADFKQGFQMWADERAGNSPKTGFMDSQDIETINTVLHREGYNDLTAVNGSYKIQREGGKSILYLLASCKIAGGGVAETTVRFEDGITNYRIIDIKRLSK